MVVGVDPASCGTMFLHHVSATKLLQSKPEASDMLAHFQVRCRGGAVGVPSSAIWVPAQDRLTVCCCVRVDSGGNAARDVCLGAARYGQP